MFQEAKMINKVTLIGNVGSDPELRETQSGKSVCSFSLATNESYKDQQGNNKQQTEWHKIKAWGKLAEICKDYLTKGKLVYIEGKIRTSSYDKDGVKTYSTEIVANQMKMLSSNQNTNDDIDY
jgi:single-strand DNA-binding protein